MICAATAVHPLPRHFPAQGFVVLPAGTLDMEVEARPGARIFCAARAEWSCGDQLPAFDGYPE